MDEKGETVVDMKGGYRKDPLELLLDKELFLERQAARKNCCINWADGTVSIKIKTTHLEELSEELEKASNLGQRIKIIAIHIEKHTGEAHG